MAYKNPVLEGIVTMEMAGWLEFWNVRDDGGVHILLAEPAHFCCGKPHTWFVNREGRTRCCDCDEAYVRGQRQAAKAMAAA
ncbi:MAG TPA: hypothetical protein VKQ28_14640 [Candidatus Acidoferrum sp.]|nr:hypothetical protein [Candidatus Acidoferrum sp.]